MYFLFQGQTDCKSMICIINCPFKSIIQLSFFENWVLSADKEIRRYAQLLQLGLGSPCHQCCQEINKIHKVSLNILVDLHVFKHVLSLSLKFTSPLTLVEMSAGDTVLAAIYIFIFIWDFLTWPIYQAVYKPWEKRKAIYRKRTKTVR